MMEPGNYVSQQLLLFLRSIGLGLCLGLLYDLLGALRQLGGKVFGGVLDGLFCLASAGAVLFFILAGDGELRIFMALGIVGGAVLFWCLLGPLLRPVWAFWLSLALLPARFLRRWIKKCGQSAKKAFSFSRNWFIIKFTTLRAKGPRRRREGENDMASPSGKKNSPAPQKKRKAAKSGRSGNKAAFLLLMALLVGISIQIYRMFGQLQSARAEEAAYAQRLEELQEANRQLQEDLDNAGSLDIIEDIARDELGMVRDGEVIFRYSK